ncbi:MAG: universal stress protein [Dehalococcoidia bacterium]|nr:universal stress protein [Dehalococcoidia bacterium]
MSQKANGHAGWGDRRSSSAALPRRPHTVLAPLDATIQSLSALPVAQALAGILGAALHVVYVGERVLSPRDILQKLGLTAEQMQGSIIHQATGMPAEEIVRLASRWHSSVIIMCTHTGEEKPRGKLGGVTAGVLDQSPIPVMLVHPERGQNPWSLKHIVVPHEGTPTAAAAIRYATDLADQTGAELIVLHLTGAEGPRPAEPGSFTGPRYLDQPQHEWPAWAKEFLTRAHSGGIPPAGVRLRLLVAKGELAPAIIRGVHQSDGDLIVLAWRGHLEAERAATIKAVTSDAPCPILIVRVER